MTPTVILRFRGARPTLRHCGILDGLDASVERTRCPVITNVYSSRTEIPVHKAREYKLLLNIERPPMVAKRPDRTVYP
jgi:hypothetical protein